MLNCTITQYEPHILTQARFRLLRRSTADTTSATGTVGVAKHNRSDASAGFSCTMNRTASSPTLGTEAGVVAIANESLPKGVRYLPTPEERQLFCGSGQYFAVNMPYVHGVTGQNVTFDVAAVVEEFN